MMVDATSDSGCCGAPEETSIVIFRLNAYGKRFWRIVSAVICTSSVASCRNYIRLDHKIVPMEEQCKVTPGTSKSDVKRHVIHF
jgi:hypothetical protein